MTMVENKNQGVPNQFVCGSGSIAKNLRHASTKQSIEQR